MEINNENKSSGINRRDFLKVAGMGAAAMAMPGVGLIKNASATSVSSIKQEIIETDVLIIGGGIAGTFAAIKAKEEGVDVILVDKGTVGKSGLSPWFGGYAYFDNSKTTKKQLVGSIAKNGNHLVNQDYIEIFAEDSMARFEDLKAWGVKQDTKGSRGVIFREQVKKAGVRIIERTMVTDLLKENDRVVGAVGFPMEEDKAVIIKAKAVVLCSGAGAFKTSGFPISSLTHDGDSMAYKIGAEISGKEFIDAHWTHWEDPADSYSNWETEWGKFKVMLSSGGSRPGPGLLMMQAMEAHKGQIPMVMGGGDMPPAGLPGENGGERPAGPRLTNGSLPGCRSMDLPIVGGATAGMSPHKCEGVFPKDDKFASSVSGLFAAGDALCTGGATYSGGGGTSSSGSAVQGGRAGIYAAEFAKKAKAVSLSNSKIDEIKKTIFEPRSRDKGYSPAWVTQVLQGCMVPYYVLYIKKQDRLESALTNIKFLREHFASKLLANDTHELRLAHETRNMLLNAEMRLRASLFRKESRGFHYREDYPEQDDKNWLAWVVISKDGENMKLTKKDVPEKWRG